MTPLDRIQAILLSEEIKENSEIAKSLGITIDFKEGRTINGNKENKK